jgi:SAM-dependent methyltransferase
MNEAAARVRWASGEVYEPYVGRWSRRAAPMFLAWLAAPPGLDWLDVGCGTGAVAEAVASLCAPRSVTAIDPSPGFLEFARRRIGAKVQLHQADAQALPFEDERFDRVISGLVLNFVPDQARALAEMHRVVRPGGEVAVYVWDYAGKMEMMRYFWDAAIALDPDASPLDEARRSPICHPDALRALFEKTGLTDVVTRALDVETVFTDFDDYWAPFLGGQAPAPAYCMSLTEEARSRLRDLLRARLPTGPDGSIPLIARAFAVRGRKG